MRNCIVHYLFVSKTISHMVAVEDRQMEMQP